MSDSKPRYVQVVGAELDYFLTHSGQLDVPSVHAFNDGPPYLANADELRLWRESQCATACVHCKGTGKVGTEPGNVSYQMFTCPVCLGSTFETGEKHG